MLAWAGVVGGAAATGWVAYRMHPSGRVMKAHGRHGIVALELAPGPRRARRIVDDWHDAGVAAAREAIRLDWWFIPSYVLFGTSLGLALHVPLASAAVAVAGSLDVVENVAMLRVLDGDANAQWVAFPAASVKWLLLAAAAFGAILWRHG